MRDKTELWDTLDPDQKPTFHEIRSLGGRQYIDAGYDKKYVQRLMTHTQAKTTDIYLKGGKITDDMYLEVRADLALPA